MTAPYDLAEPAGPPRRPSEDELATMPTVRIPLQRRPAPIKRGAPLLVTALINTTLAALTCLVPLLLIAVAFQLGTGGSAGGLTIPVGLAGWLLAHGVPLATTTGEIGLAPLSITLLAVWRLSRAGVHTTRGIGARDTGSVRHALVVAVAVGSVHAVFGLTAALIVNRPVVGVSPLRAAAQFLLLGTFAALLGSIRASGALRRLARRTPLLWRDALRTAVVSALAMLGAGAALVGVAVALNGKEAADIFAAYHADGLPAQAAILLISLAFALDFAAWGTAYLLGPGFQVGTEVVIRPGGVVIAPDAHMVFLPVFGGLPGGPLSGVGWALLALPILAAASASGLLVWRRVRPRLTRAGDVVLPLPRWRRMTGSVAVAAPMTGVLLGAMGFVSSGLFGGSVSTAGPVIWQVMAAATLAALLGGLLGEAAGWIYVRRQLRVAGAELEEGDSD